MIKPTFYYHSVKDIDVLDIKSLNKKYCLVDMDNTLSIFNKPNLEEIGEKFVKDLQTNNILVLCISNNTSKRIKKALDNLEVDILSLAFKPFKGRTLKFLKKHNLDIKDGILIGDQCYTDIKLANKIHMDSILVDPLVNDDKIQTKFNRMLDKKLRKRLKDEGLLKKINERQDM